MTEEGATMQGGKVTMLADLSRLDHAKAVAAALVEVIVAQEAEIDGWTHMLSACRDERDVARAEVADLTRWKEEATAVIGSWERVWKLLGEPGVIGESKAEATWVAVRNLLDWIACGGPVEAKRVIESWERVWTLLGTPGFIGESKAEAAWVEVRDLLDARGELVEAKRAKREADRDRNFAIAMANALMLERDAARAEVAALSGSKEADRD